MRLEWFFPQTMSRNIARESSSTRACRVRAQSERRAAVTNAEASKRAAVLEAEGEWDLYYRRPAQGQAG